MDVSVKIILNMRPQQSLYKAIDVLPYFNHIENKDCELDAIANFQYGKTSYTLLYSFCIKMCKITADIQLDQYFHRLLSLQSKDCFLPLRKNGSAHPRNQEWYLRSPRHPPLPVHQPADRKQPDIHFQDQP